MNLLCNNFFYTKHIVLPYSIDVVSTLSYHSFRRIWYTYRTNAKATEFDNVSFWNRIHPTHGSVKYGYHGRNGNGDIMIDSQKSRQDNSCKNGVIKCHCYLHYPYNCFVICGPTMVVDCNGYLKNVLFEIILLAQLFIIPHYVVYV